MVRPHLKKYSSSDQCNICQIKLEYHVCTSLGAMPEELTLDYTEISSIPPLPLWTLLAADHEVSSKSSEPHDDLFQNSNLDAHDNIDSFLEEESDDRHRPVSSNYSF